MIDPAARVDPAAKVADDAEVGPWCVLGPEVEVASGAVLADRVRLEGRVSVGEGARLSRCVTVGAPQHTGHEGAHSTRIGAGAVLREFVTVHGSTGEEPTEIGAGAYLMAFSHAGHDSRVGEGAVLTNLVQLGGHVRVGRRAVLGGGAMVHQRLEIGAYAMVGGMSGVRASVPPFTMASGPPQACHLVGINRHPFHSDPERRRRVKAAIDAWRDADDTRTAVEALSDLGTPEATELAEFLGRWPVPARWAK